MGGKHHTAYAQISDTLVENSTVVEITLSIGEEYLVTDMIRCEVVDNNSIITIDNNSITAKQKGEALIYVTDSLGNVIRYHIIVNENPELIVAQEPLILLTGDTKQLNSTIQGVYTGKLSYLSGDDQIVTINQEGVLIGLKEGECDITISLDTGLAKTVHIIVVNNIATITVKYLEKNNQLKLAVGQSRVVYPIISIDARLKDKLDKSLVYSSIDSKIATVDSEGRITGKKIGRTTILIQLESDNRVICELTVTVTKRRTTNLQSSSKLNIVGVKHATYTYEEMQSDIKKLKKAYGDRLQISSLGQSYDNREIYLIVIGNTEAKRKVLIQSAMHGREYMAAQLTMKQIEFYCKNYYSGFYKGKYYSELFDKCAFYIIPMMNPDGVTISQFGASGINNKKLRDKIIKIRKKEHKSKWTDYYKNWKANARGVDLNSNFDSNWSSFNDRHSGPASKGYKGKSAASEKESQILVDLYEDINPSITINYHATGSVIYWNFGQKESLYKKTVTWRNRIKKLTNYSLIYNRNGKTKAPGFGDWVSRKKKSVVFTIEIGTEICPLKTSSFQKIWNKNKLIYAELARYK
jgi:g-D-glutamyl-meso-diaminopimelate peptidase